MTLFFAVQWLWSFKWWWWSIDEKRSATFNGDLSHFQSNKIPRISTTTQNIRSRTHHTRERDPMCRGIVQITMTYEISMHVNVQTTKKKKWKEERERSVCMFEWWHCWVIMINFNDAHSFRPDIDKGDYGAQTSRIIEHKIIIFTRFVLFNHFSGLFDYDSDRIAHDIQPNQSFSRMQINCS